MRATCPYRTQPATARWPEAVSRVAPTAIDPTIPAPFAIDRRTRVASACSCFAQHIRNQFVRRGYNYLITEPGPADFDQDKREDRGYGAFPARFGNIYTTLQAAVAGLLLPPAAAAEPVPRKCRRRAMRSGGRSRHPQVPRSAAPLRGPVFARRCPAKDPAGAPRCSPRPAASTPHSGCYKGAGERK